MHQGRGSDLSGLNVGRIRCYHPNPDGLNYSCRVDGKFDRLLEWHLSAERVAYQMEAIRHIRSLASPANAHMRLAAGHLIPGQSIPTQTEQCPGYQTSAPSETAGMQYLPVLIGVPVGVVGFLILACVGWGLLHRQKKRNARRYPRDSRPTKASGAHTEAGLHP